MKKKHLYKISEMQCQNTCQIFCLKKKCQELMGNMSAGGGQKKNILNLIYNNEKK